MTDPADESPTASPSRVCLSHPITLQFNGRSIRAYRGDTVASALYRAGVRIFTRSFKYHRPRGLMCATGRCPNCLMQVDGTPNVRACITPVWDSQQVHHQNAYPSPDFDLLGAADYLGWLMPVGFYYKTFTHPAVWHLVEPLIRRVAGLGKVAEAPQTSQGPTTRYEHLHLHADVGVIGGGPSGMKAVLEAAGSGKTVVLVDDQPELGGHLLDEIAPVDVDATGNLKGRTEGVIPSVHQHPNIRVLSNAYCFGLYEDNLLGIEQRDIQSTTTSSPLSVVERLIHLRADQVVLATGTYEVPLPFPNNDRVGVMLSTGVKRLINRYQIQPGKRAVIVSTDPEGGPIANQIRSSGARVVGVVSPKEIRGVTGRRRVTGVSTNSGRLACDLVVVCGRRLPDVGLVGQAGGKLAWDDPSGVFVSNDLPPNVRVVGSATGESLDAAGVYSGPEIGDGKRSFVCYCEDVTTKDLDQAIAEGFDHIQTLKRYSTVTMGPCQGRMCQLASIGICAQRTGKTMAETGTTTARPPLRSVSLGALAGARHHPVRRTPMHSRHESLGCVWMNMGEWKRPHHYRMSGGGDSEQCIRHEYNAVREGVGMIDVSTLGKIDVQGADAVKLLEKVYTGRAADLRVGRTRYSVVCDETGILLDDGTISRLAEDHFFLTTTTGNVEFMESWLKWSQAGTGWCAHVTNVTGGYAVMNVAGPKARDVLVKVADCDLSPQGFRYMACRQAKVGGVPCLMLRTGFVGEMSWELYCPSSYGESLWELLSDVGREFGIQPVGVEAQRLLRLEKKHVIIGVDTDATSNPLEADLAWVAKLSKDDFIGKSALVRLQSTALKEKLVGFLLEDDTIPEDGAAVVLDGRPVGRVTSVRYSPSQAKAVGLAWIAAEAAEQGREFQIHSSGRVSTAKVVSKPFYDPEGKRLRS